MDRASNDAIKDYTQQEILEKIVQIEDCYRRFVLNESDKIHIKGALLAVSGYSREASKYIDSNRKNWEEIIRWVRNKLDELPQLNRDTTEGKDYIYSIIEQVKEIRLKASPSFCPTCRLREMLHEK